MQETYLKCLILFFFMKNFKSKSEENLLKSWAHNTVGGLVYSLAFLLLKDLGSIYTKSLT